MTHSEQALQWLSEGKTVIFEGREVSCRYGSVGPCDWRGIRVSWTEFNQLVAQNPEGLTYKEPEPKVIVTLDICRASNDYPGYTYARGDLWFKGNVTEAQVKAALESIGEKQ